MIKSQNVVISDHLIKKTITILRQYGKSLCEGFVLWVASENKQYYQVQDVWNPSQENYHFQYFIPEEEVYKICVQLNKKKLVPIAQIHSHPGRAYHSTTDDDYAILHLPNLFSIVVPDFGDIKYNRFFDDCVVFQLINNSWIEQKIDQVKKTFKITH